MQLIEVYKKWQNQQNWLLHNINLKAEKKQITAILGESGVGKSTLLKIIAGLIRPDKGRIQIEGKDITTLPAHKRNLGYLPQNYALFPHLSVLDNICFGLIEQGYSKSKAREQTKKIVSKFELSHTLTTPVWQLSGGEQQRVALARMLIVKPKAMLLDEPFAAVDQTRQQILKEYIYQAVQENNIPALLITHDIESAEKMAHKIYHLEDKTLRCTYLNN